MNKDNAKLKHRSNEIFDVIKNTPYYFAPLGIISGLGLEEKEIKNKPFIGVVNTWNEVNPGHKHLRDLAIAVKEGIIENGGIPFEFCTIAPCDGWANGNVGMRYILPQREIIADSIEAMVEAHRLDAMVTLSSCDKINPAILMAAVRLDIPTICVPGGPNFFEIEFSPDYKGIDNKLYDDFIKKTKCVSCATYGACEFMGTANTTQCLMEAFGMTLANAATIPATTRMKYAVAKNSGRQIMELLKKNITPSMIMNEKSLENAIIVDMALGGSTNSTLHLPAIANEMGLDFNLEDFNEFCKKTPMIVNVSPSGDYGTVDLYRAGGIPALLSRLKDFLNLECLTVTGKPIGKNIRRVKVLNEDVIRPLDNPLFPEGGTVILKGNLAPDGAVVKQSAISNKNMMKYTGPAKCFNSERAAIEALSNHEIENGTVMIIKYEGPKGGPGMPELVALTANLMLRKDMNNVALITDGRFSGATAGPCIGHVCPEAYGGGPIAIIQDEDLIEIDIPNLKLNVKLPDNEIKNRLKDWNPYEKDIKSRTLLKYRALVTSADKGAILKF
ncbi:MAG: dihydroxy-acid dehydratase [Candidatus Lokiarchaeota archaeon]|nr:dihydroxy-acid dehydratase [Candidatus Lokiarchaeota archaeon]